MGHLMRTLTIAQALACEDFDCEFLCRDLPGNNNGKIKKNGFVCHEIKNQNLRSELSLLPWIKEKTDDAAQPTILVDNYNVDKAWEVSARSIFDRIITIDDLADRQFDCDLIINPNFNRSTSDYFGLASMSTKILAGPAYALIRQEFSSKRDQSILRKLNNKACRRVLIIFGGGNTASIIRQTLLAIPQRVVNGVLFDVVIGSAVSDSELLMTEFSKNHTIRFHKDPDSIADLMLNADLAISAAGGTVLESFCMGLPSVITSIAENQDAIANWLHGEQLCLYFSLQEPDSLKQCLDTSLENPNGLKVLCEKTSALVDGRGRERVAASIKTLLSQEIGV